MPVTEDLLSVAVSLPFLAPQDGGSSFLFLGPCGFRDALAECLSRCGVWRPLCLHRLQMSFTIQQADLPLSYPLALVLVLSSIDDTWSGRGKDLFFLYYQRRGRLVSSHHVR